MSTECMSRCWKWLLAALSNVPICLVMNELGWVVRSSKPSSPAMARSSPSPTAHLRLQLREARPQPTPVLVRLAAAGENRRLLRTQAAKRPHRKRDNQSPQKPVAPRLTVFPKTSKSSSTRSPSPMKFSPTPTTGKKPARSIKTSSTSSRPYVLAAHHLQASASRRRNAPSTTPISAPPTAANSRKSSATASASTTPACCRNTGR